MAEPARGILLLDKPADWTSHDVVAYARGVTGVRQIGHTGTLDPFATGLLILLVGDATKLAADFHHFSKTYEATVRLGMATDTYDRTGKVTAEQPGAAAPSRAQVEAALAELTGEIEQTPPPFSAKKVGGKKAYDLARAGRAVELKPAKVTVEDIELRRYSYPQLELAVRCSTGTYIRSLAHDVGQKLDVGATLWELRRTAIGPYSVADATGPKQLDRSTWRERLLPT